MTTWLQEQEHRSQQPMEQQLKCLYDDLYIHDLNLLYTSKSNYRVNQLMKEKHFAYNITFTAIQLTATVCRC